MHDDPAADTQGQPQATVEGDGAAENGVWTSSSALGGDRSPNDVVCPFLRAVDENDTLGAPIEAPDPVNRCAALRDPVPQSLRQQELVCLTSGHMNCPRYLRGSIVTSPPAPVQVSAGPTASRTMTPAIVGALVVLFVAFMVSLGFVVSTGGLVLTAAAPGASGTGGVLAELESAAPTAAPTPVPTASPSPSPTPSPSPSPSPSLSPTPTPTPTPTPRPRPTSDRYALLKPCPGTANCYLYVIRSGNNLYSIANYFGVPLKTVQAMNPWTANGIKPGQTLRLPPPTR